MTQRRPSTITQDLLVYLRDDAARIALEQAERDGGFDRDFLKELSKRGIFSLGLSAAYGGHDLPLVERVEFHQSLSALSASLQSIVTANELVTLAISRHDDTDEAQKWLKAIGSGDVFASFALTEPTGGSSLANVETTVASSGDVSVLTGKKMWISGASNAGVFLVVAKDRGEVSTVLVDRAATSLEVQPSDRLNAFRAAGLCDLEFDGTICTPIGNRGFGSLLSLTSCLTLGRIFVAAGAVGISRASLELAIQQAGAREVGATLQARLPLVQSTVAEAYLAIASGRGLIDASVRSHSQNSPFCVREAVVAKLMAARTVRQVTSAAVRLAGARGLKADGRLHQYAADALVYDIIEGSDELLISVLGEDVMNSGLGLFDTSFTKGRA